MIYYNNFEILGLHALHGHIQTGTSNSRDDAGGESFGNPVILAFEPPECPVRRSGWRKM